MSTDTWIDDSERQEQQSTDTIEQQSEQTPSGTGNTTQANTDSANTQQGLDSTTTNNTAQPQNPNQTGGQNSGSTDTGTPTTEPTQIEDGLILIRGGSYTMGSPSSERQRQSDETPHTVRISDFYADPYEVTQADYRAIMGSNPSHFSGNNLPVENVTWYDAVNYCNALSRSRGLTPVYTINGTTVSWNRSANGYRLLTEAEWEYACRAGTTTIYSVGNQVHSNYVNFEGSYPYLIEENYVTRRDPSVVTSRYRGTTIAVNELAPNSFGMYNMHGNVSEWVWDYYGNYNLQNTTNPAGSTSGSLRVNRGGSYNDFGKHLRSAYRSATNPVDTDQNLGFRIGRNATAVEGTVTTTYSLNIRVPSNPRILIASFLILVIPKTPLKLFVTKRVQI